MASDPSHAPPSSNSAPTAPVAPPVPAPSRCLPRLVRWAVWCAAGGIAIVAAYLVIHWWTYRLSHSITGDACVDAHIVNVAPETVSGRIVRFHVEENDRVEQGQVLAEIEAIHYRDQVEQARGKLELAEAELKRQEAGLTKLKNEVPLQINVAEKTVEEAHAAVSVAKANLTLARREYDRFTKLAEQDATTIRKAEEVTRAHDAARAEARLADTRVAKADKMLDLAKTGYDQIREVELLAGVKKEVVKDAQIALDSAKHVLQFTQ